MVSPLLEKTNRDMFSEGNYAHPIGCESPAESNGSLAHFFVI
jgi:hypothetical protein